MGVKSLPWQRQFQRLLGFEKVRFALVGGINTGVDFVVFLILTLAIGLLVVPANIISTSCAMAVSYLLNKHAVFRGSTRSGRNQFIQFIIVTVTGQWVVQTILIVMFSQVLDVFVGGSAAVIITLSKILAIGVSLIWNYWWYSRVVFKKESV